MSPSSITLDGPARAARVMGAGLIQVDTLDVPTVPGPGQVEIQLAGCGICGSNIHHLRNPDVFTEDRRHTPGALGHEASGYVVSLGDGVAGLAVGDLVALEPQLAAGCGRCPACVDGSAWFCPNATPLKIWGFADRIVVQAAGAWRIDPAIDPSVATLMEGLACSIHAIRVTELCGRLNDDLAGVRVAILGAGATGLLAVAAAKALGAVGVAILARHDHQAVLAERLGASLVVREHVGTEGELADFAPGLVVECVGGAADTISLAQRIAQPQAEISVLGLFETPQAIDVRTATRRQLRLVFPVVYGRLRGQHDYEFAERILLDQSETLSGLITHSFPSLTSPRPTSRPRPRATAWCGSSSPAVRPPQALTTCD